MLGYQSHLLQRRHIACAVTMKDLPISPVLLSHLMNLYRDVSSALLQLVHRWLNFTYYSLRSHAFHYGFPQKSGFHKNRTHDFRTN